MLSIFAFFKTFALIQNTNIKEQRISNNGNVLNQPYIQKKSWMRFDIFSSRNLQLTRVWGKEGVWWATRRGCQKGDQEHEDIFFNVLYKREK